MPWFRCCFKERNEIQDVIPPQQRFCADLISPDVRSFSTRGLSRAGLWVFQTLSAHSGCFIREMGALPGRQGNPGIYHSVIREGSKTAIKVTIKPNPNQRGPWTTNWFFSSVFLCGICNTPTPVRRFGWLGPYQLIASQLARTTHTSLTRAGIWCLLPGRTDNNRQVQIK